MSLVVELGARLAKREHYFVDIFSYNSRENLANIKYKASLALRENFKKAFRINPSLHITKIFFRL